VSRRVINKLCDNLALLWSMAKTVDHISATVSSSCKELVASWF